MYILLADDRAEVRSALRLILEQPPGQHTVGETVNFKSLLAQVEIVCPDLVLLDWELADLPGQQMLGFLHNVCPRLRVIALSGRQDARQTALAAGVDAFVSKVDPPERLLAAIEFCLTKEG